MDAPAKKKVGRPPKAGVAFTNAQRQAEYRKRAYEKASMAAENVTDAATMALLAGLTRQIKLIKNDPGYAPTGRLVAKKLITELCNRYKIPLK